jgi:hypothetical protein
LTRSGPLPSLLSRRLTFFRPIGIETSQQPTHAETGDNYGHREIRQQKKTVGPQIDLLARAGGQAVDNARRCSDCIVACRE